MRASRSSVVVGATSGTSASPAASHAASTAGASSSGRSGTISPLAPAAAAAAANSSTPRASTMFAYVISTTGTRGATASQIAQHVVDARPARERARGGGLDHGPVGDRVGERHAELDQVGAAVDVRLRDRERRRRRPGSRPSGRASAPRACRCRRTRRRSAAAPVTVASVLIARPRRSMTSARSLSPRPDRQTRSIVLSDGSRSTTWSACAVSSAGMMPSSRATSRTASSAWSSVTAT